jgi:acyl-CoA thioesterase-1
MMEGVWGDPRLLIGDGLHPNAAGIAKMVDHMLPEVEKMLSSMASEKK